MNLFGKYLKSLAINLFNYVGSYPLQLSDHPAWQFYVNLWAGSVPVMSPWLTDSMHSNGLLLESVDGMRGEDEGWSQNYCSSRSPPVSPLSLSLAPFLPTESSPLGNLHQSSKATPSSTYERLEHLPACLVFSSSSWWALLQNETKEKWRKKTKKKEGRPKSLDNRRIWNWKVRTFKLLRPQRN